MPIVSPVLFWSNPFLLMLFPTDDDGSAPNIGTRILLFTGKGGVGKTTCAAATALRAARQGKKTLILSSDPAHSLADALDRDLGPEAQEVADHLFAQEVDLYYSMKKYWGNMRELMLTVFRWQGVDQIAAEEMAALPGMNEGSVLLWLEQALREEDYAVAARLLGASHGRIIFMHLLPGFTSHIIVSLSLSVPAMILGETALSFLGLGIQPPTPSWGNLLTNAQELIWSRPALAVYPGLLIFITVIAFNFLGDGLRDALDPRAVRR